MLLTNQNAEIVACILLILYLVTLEGTVLQNFVCQSQESVTSINSNIALYCCSPIVLNYTNLKPTTSYLIEMTNNISHKLFE